MTNRKTSKSAADKWADDMIEQGNKETQIANDSSVSNVNSTIVSTNADAILAANEAKVAEVKATIKRNRKPQAEANVSLFVYKYTPDMYHVYAKQGHSIVAVYGFIPSIDSFLNLAPTNEIAKAWGSMYETVKAVSQQVGTFQPAIAYNIQFVNTLVATVIKANTLTTKLDETEATV